MIVMLVVSGASLFAQEDDCLLRHRFAVGQARRYRCEQTTVEQVISRDEDEGVVSARLDASPMQQLTFVEEEGCHAIDENGVADVSYRCVSMGAYVVRDGKRVYKFESEDPTELRKKGHALPIDTSGVIFDTVHYRVDPDMNVVDAQAPRSHSGRHRKQMNASYEKALNARYRSFFPRELIGPGDVHETRIPFQEGLWQANEQVEATEYTVRLEHLGYEEKEGLRCAVLGITMKLGDGGVAVLRRDTNFALSTRRFRAVSKVWFAVAEGTPVLEESSIEVWLDRQILRGKDVASTTHLAVRQTIRTALIARDVQIPAP
ncbi:MAG: hypothetical protein KDB53_05065 [Planctomycetes bacterium]|nr:hypothetical protein [Planctomycetota bacterium]